MTADKGDLVGRDAELAYATRFLCAFVEQNFPHNPDWKPLPDLMGVLTQIDNATTITRDLRAQLASARNALEELKFWNEGIKAGRGNHHPQDHLNKINDALKEISK